MGSGVFVGLVCNDGPVGCVTGLVEHVWKLCSGLRLYSRPGSLLLDQVPKDLSPAELSR